LTVALVKHCSKFISTTDSGSLEETRLSDSDSGATTLDDDDEITAALFEDVVSILEDELDIDSLIVFAAVSTNMGSTDSISTGLSVSMFADEDVITT
jgi:hypothetical protein